MTTNIRPRTTSINGIKSKKNYETDPRLQPRRRRPLHQLSLLRSLWYEFSTFAQPILNTLQMPPKIDPPQIQKAKSSTPVPTEAEFEFSDTTAMTCLLCARQFKSLDQLKRHNKESDLHKVWMSVLADNSDTLIPPIGTSRKTSRMQTFGTLPVKKPKPQN